MLTKKGKEFIDLRERRDYPEVATVSAEPERRGPTVYISDADLPLSDDDINVVVTAQVKVRLRNLSVRVDSDKKTRKSYDLEIVGIKFGE